MRRIIAQVAVTLDGFIEGPNGEVDWKIDDDAYYNRLVAEFDTAFYGRLAYERLGFPRPVHDSQTEDASEFNCTLNNMRKYVFSFSRTHVQGNGMVINHRFFEEVERIKSEKGKDIWLCGGAKVIKTFTALNLVDEFRLAMHPKILGAGKPLFDFSLKHVKLNLIKVQPLESGVVLMVYRPIK